MSTPQPDNTDFLTVEEAARVLRIGRTAAYALARIWRETDGREGLPVVPFGRLLRVPRAALEAISGAPITPPAPTNVPAQARVESRGEPRLPAGPHRGRHRRTRRVDPDQAVLPLD